MPRRGAEAVDPEDISLVELYRVHAESAERAAAVRNLYINLNVLNVKLNESTENIF